MKRSRYLQHLQLRNAQEHMRFDSLGQPVMYGANLKVDGAVGLKAIDG